jgi:hypothetical protein
MRRHSRRSRLRERGVTVLLRFRAGTELEPRRTAVRSQWSGSLSPHPYAVFHLHRITVRRRDWRASRPGVPLSLRTDGWGCLDRDLASFAKRNLAQHDQRTHLNRSGALLRDYTGGSGRPAMFHEMWWTAPLVARMADLPGAKARPTSPCPATSRLALPCGVILTMPRRPVSEAAT